MKMIRTSVWVACVLLCAAAANADVVSIKHTMDYQDNDWAAGVWFAESGVILDHSPYCRVCNEDWGWTHVVSNFVPRGATGIDSATLTIVAWKIDVELGEDDVIYALPEAPESTSAAKKNGINLGLLKSAKESPISVTWAGDGQIYGYENYWSTTTFELSADVIEDLWRNGEICFYIDIDQTSLSGMRATLESAVLQVNYIAPTPEAPTLMNVYRFWSELVGSHFYAAGEDEANYVIDNYPKAWTYEGPAFRALADDSDTMAVPVYRFWSPVVSSHFYTASEDEVDYVTENFPETWVYEGIVFYVYPPDYQPVDTYPVYRYWSNIVSRHFYTISKVDMAYIDEYLSEVWLREGIAWYAYKPEEKIKVQQ